MKPIYYIAIASVAALGGYFIFGGNNASTASESQTITAGQDDQVLKFSASINNRSYSPGQIDVPFGAEVELTVKNNDNEQHGLSFPDFGVQAFVGPGQTKTVRFIANRKGQASSFCSTAHPEKLIINVN